MVKRLVSFGSSVVFGAELSDTNSDTNCSQLSFAALIAKYHSLDYSCRALMGGSNDTIIRQITEYTRTDIQDDFALIGWTSNYRKDYPISNSMQTFHVGNPHGYKNFVVQDAHDWIMTHASTELITQTFLDQVFIAHRILESYGIPHAMVNCLGNIKSPLIINLQDIQSWATAGSYAFGPNQHPLEAAHSDYATLLMNYLRITS